MIRSSYSEHDINLARQEAVSFLSYSLRSSGKLYRHLLSKNIPVDLADFTVAAMREERYLNDMAIIEAQWNHRKGSRGEAFAYFALRMQKLGIAADIISEFAATLDVYEEDMMSLQDLLQHKYCNDIAEIKECSGNDKLRRRKLCQRLCARLQAKSYNFAQIKECLAEQGITLFDY